ncbi:immunoglobulin kappa light chain-like isoform X2 [Heterodontus francisci]|uniref:immunoglobulin kappa light chain-like isoform X2 n=1 Tax=Heterodontus francisci TaxID=7792 RepID=UPI00355C7C38
MFREAFSLMLIFQVLRVYVADSEPFLSQSPFTVTAEVGQTVELTCHQRYQVLLVTSYFWYKQLVGEAPRLIDIPPCDGTDCKFTSKKGNSKYELKLEIRNVQVNDSGSYYCAYMDSYAPLQNGPTLLVGDSSTNKTAMLVFVPPGELHLRETVPLVCLVSGVSSKQIVIFWNISGQLTEGRSDSGTMQPDGTYSIRSHVMVSAESWRSGGVCTCIAELGSPGKSWTKSVSISKAVSVSVGSCNLLLPFAITGALILILLFILISICIHKRGRSERVRRPHNENFSLRERTQRGERNERRSDDNRQTEAQRTRQGAIQSQGGPTYASLEFAALEKRSKKKAGRI